jgi:hypothetical protein
MGQIGGRTTTRQQREGPLLVCAEWGSCNHESSGRREVVDRNVIWATTTTRALDAAANGQDDTVVRVQDIAAFPRSPCATAAA